MADKQKKIKITKWRIVVLLASLILFLASIINIGNIFGQVMLVVGFILFEIWFFSHKYTS